MRPIILDRDGVINVDSEAYVKSANEWIPIPGSIEAIARLSHAGFSVFIATNQSGIGRGLFSEHDLALMHEKLRRLVENAGGHVQGICFCPHRPDDNCNCRKPKTGLLTAIENQFNCKLKNAYFIGDSVKDLQAATSHGCKPVLVKTGKGLESVKTLENLNHINYTVYADLNHAVSEILAGVDDAFSV
jgi:D-glycero-D-manno-heptose 1,7-bisphosphate phosphatase